MSESSNVKITLAGRVDPKSIALAAQFVIKGTEEKVTKSNLVSFCFDIVAHLAKKAGGYIEPQYYEDAFTLLKELGIEFQGNRVERERRKALQLDALTDLTPDQADELRDLVTDMRRRNFGDTIEKAKRSEAKDASSNVSDSEVTEMLKELEQEETQEKEEPK